MPRESAWRRLATALITAGEEAVSDCKGFGRCLIWVIYAETILRRERKSRGAEACHCTEIIHVLITPPVCLWMSCAEPLLSLQLSTL